MSKDFDDWLYHNVCPWCNELYSDVDHSAGCPRPSDVETERAKRIREFVSVMFDPVGDHDWR